MAGIPAVLGEPELRICWCRGFRHHFTDRYVGKPDTFRHSIEGVITISELSISCSVISTNYRPYELSEFKHHAQNNGLQSHLYPGDFY